MLKTNFSENISNRNHIIDLFRGISILFVILLHLNLQVKFSDTYLGSLLSKEWYRFFFWSGYYGVVLFFVISGYLITTTSLKRWNSLLHIPITTFYWFRFARIMPLLILLILILSLLHLLAIP